MNENYKLNNQKYLNNFYKNVQTFPITTLSFCFLITIFVFLSNLLQVNHLPIIYCIPPFILYSSINKARFKINIHILILIAGLCEDLIFFNILGVSSLFYLIIYNIVHLAGSYHHIIYSILLSLILIICYIFQVLVILYFKNTYQLYQYSSTEIMQTQIIAFCITTIITLAVFFFNRKKRRMTLFI